MRANFAGVLLVLLLFSVRAQAQTTSYHLANPVGTMYDLPVGEAPGWSAHSWFNLDIGVANIWNENFSMSDKRNGNLYQYQAQFEEEIVTAEFGTALSDDLALSFEVPYANHNGGFLDDFIDQFHTAIGSDRFGRNNSPAYGNHFNIQTNGQNNLASQHAEGVGNIKTKLKYWFWHWQSETPGACDCGLAISGQIKFPVQPADHGLTSGHNDYSGLVHFGMPINYASAFWFTAAVSKLGSNDNLPGWPVHTWQQMYEASTDFAITEHFGLLFQGRLESPLLDKSLVSFDYTTYTAKDQTNERINSGWNSLMYWRGSESIGVRWRRGQGEQINFLFQEDWNIGGEDQRGDDLYINNAPDFTFMTQFHFSF